MKLLISFIDPEINFILKKSKILKKEFIFKTKKNSSILYKLEHNNNTIFLAKLGMGATFSLLSLQKIVDNYAIDEVLIFGSCGSFKENISKVVIIEEFKFLSSSFLYKDLTIKNKIKKYRKKFKDLEIFHNISADRVVHEDEFDKVENISFDMEKSYISYALELNNIPSITIVVLTDNGDLNFKLIKRIYNEKTAELEKIIEFFIAK